MEEVGLVPLVPVDVIASICISISTVRMGYGIHLPVIMITLPRNNLERFTSTVPSENNSSTTTPLVTVIGSISRRTLIPREVVLILNAIWMLL